MNKSCVHEFHRNIYKKFNINILTIKFMFSSWNNLNKKSEKVRMMNGYYGKMDIIVMERWILSSG